MDAIQADGDSRVSFHFERPRINRLLTEAAQFPLVTICAGAGYGKTSAVHDFVRGSAAVIVWTQLTARDNVGTRFWENYVNTVSRVNPPYAKAIRRLGFPDSDDKINKYLSIRRSHLEIKPRIVVIDDFHFIEDPAVMYFLERMNTGYPPGTSLFLIARSTSNFNIASLVSKGLMFNIGENELRFTEGELAQYFRRQGILSPRQDELREIYEDTDGWAFAVNLVARSYQNAPAYKGFLRNAMKTNIFALMEIESYSGTSERLQNFFIRLSLIGHLSVDMVKLLAGGDDGLISEFKSQNAYVRLDSYTNAYLIHHLFLAFLREKHALLTEDEKRATYKIAADWCNRNGFRIDALSYYEKVGDYESIVGIFSELPIHIPYDIARYTAEIFDRAPEEAFDRVTRLAAMRVRAVMRLGLWSETSALMERYEKKYLSLPDDNAFRNHTLGGIYYCWGIMRTLMCTTDDRYDFDAYYAKMDECLTRSPITDTISISRHPIGPWVSLTGSARKGAPQDYIDALTRAEVHTSHCLSGTMKGMADLARGELLFYQGLINAAEPFIVYGLDRAREHGQFEVMQLALFYLLRIAVYQGLYAKAEQALKDMDELLHESAYTDRFITYDIALGWYYLYLEMPELVPDWLKEKFAPFGHAYFIENYGNRVKARYHYFTNNYAPLLAYAQELRQRESILYGRLEVLSLEACAHFKMKNRREAFAVLKEAYETAAPNDIFVPFIIRGKDMRALCSAALKEPSHGVPADWLEMIKSRSSSYTKRQSHIISEYRRTNHLQKDVTITPRETDIITDLLHGLSRSEIAASRDLSANAVKIMINAIYEKLGAENLADLIRISVARKLI